MTIQKIRSSRVSSIDADQFTGEKGMIFYNEDLGDLRISDGETLGGIFLSNGSGSGSYTLPVATATRLGGVKIGDNITISNGVISVNPPFNKNYNELLNKPFIPTDFSQLTDNTSILASLGPNQNLDGGHY